MCSAVHTCTVYVQLHLVPSVTSRGVWVACCPPTRTVAHAQYISKRQIASIMINLCKETLSGFHQNLSCLSFSLLLKFLRLKLQQVSWLCAQRNKWFSLQSLCCWFAWHVVLPYAHAWISKVLKLQLVSWLCVKKWILVFITICACLYHSWKKNTMFELVVLDLYYITVTKQVCEFHHDSQCEEADWRWWWWWMIQTTGSLYFWAAHLAGPRWGPLASWVCAWLEAIGLIAGIGTQVFCLFLLKLLLLLLLTTVLLQMSCFPVGLMSEWIESKGYTNTHTSISSWNINEWHNLMNTTWEQHCCHWCEYLHSYNNLAD